MEDKKISVVSNTKQSKIVRFKLEETCVSLRKSGLSYHQIAEELTAHENTPEGEVIDKFVVSRFLEKMPEIQRQLVSSDKRRLLDVVNTNFDILDEVGRLFSKTKSVLELLEDDAMEKGRIVNVYQWKAVTSEMREMLRHMTEIQHEINDYNNIRKFMDIVITVLKEEAPDKLPIIAERLKSLKGSQWFSDMMGKSEEKGD